MRVVFLGTPDFAVESLKALVASSNEVVAVVTQPDRPVGRKAVVMPSPVKSYALNCGLKVLQYERISAEGEEELRSLCPDIMVTCAYGQILKKNILNIAPHGIINVHASLLPKYRGASPVQHAVLNGDKISGVTIMQTEEGIDTGDILAVREVEIGEEETAGELFDELSKVGADLLVETLSAIESGGIRPIKQDESKATHVKTIRKEDALIDWSRSAIEVKNLVRGMNPWPIAYTYHKGKMLKIYSVSVLNESGKTGVVKRAKGELVVSCGVGAVRINELQLEGSKRMLSKEFINGNRIAEGDKLNNA